MRRTAAFLALLLSALVTVPAAVAAQAQAGAPTTIIFVRHAEAGAGDPKNPGLTPAGEQRAQALVKALSGARITAVYTSQYERTMQTGGFVAKAAGITPVVVPVGGSIDTDAAALVARIQREQPGGTVLVVGHSNTVPVMAKHAFGAAVDPIADTEYDRMYTVMIRDGVARIIQGRY